MDQGVNWTLAQAINGLAGHFPVADEVAALIAQDLVFLLFLSVVVWWFLPNTDDAGKHAALTAAVAVIFGQLVNMAIGHILFVPRPFIAHTVQLLVDSARDSAFPSDHSTAAFGIAVTGILWRMPGSRLILLAASLIAFARVYVGAHYPADVIAGAGLGTIWALLFFKLNSRLAYPYSLVITAAKRLHLA